MGDFSTHQPAPAKRNNDADAVEAGTPKSGISEAPRVGLAETGPGKGVPANKRTIR
jgi:hypothetical protein